MQVQQTVSGTERRLEASGVGRFVGAPFLSIWLAGWGVGEFFALSVISKGARSIFAGHSHAGADPVGVGMALAGGLFLLVWLAFWTLAGLAAGSQLLRTLFGRDVLVSRHDALRIQHHYGLFKSVKEVPREEIRRFYAHRSGVRSASRRRVGRSR
jgi:hypothetical protein